MCVTVHIAHIIVTLNYGVGAYVGFKDDMQGFAIYCVIFTCLWAITGILFVKRANDYLRLFDNKEEYQ